MVRFQSTHPRGVRRASATFLAATARVSIHAPAWGATWYTSQTSSPLLSFNPRTRVGCDINADIDRWNYDQFQSTHPRGVRHRQRPAASVPAAVSIHAPAWGATHAILLFQQTKIQFQSTHPRGVRPGGVGGTSLFSPCFNPRTRVGCDAMTPCASGWIFPGFNPRTRVGCDMPGIVPVKGHDQFQSTHPRGVRPGPHSPRSIPAWFQSTHPRGVRQGRFDGGAGALRVSIHAPAWGATTGMRATCRKVGAFQSTHPRGVRRRI